MKILIFEATMKWTRTFASIMLVLHCLSLSAQEIGRSPLYLDDARDNSALFRSNSGKRYNLLYDGTYFWSSDDFGRGGVMYDGRWYEPVYINIDAYDQELLVRHDSNGNTVNLKRDLVDYAEIDGSRFVNLRRSGYDVPVGFYEEVFVNESYKVYKQINKRLENDYFSSGSGSGIISNVFNEKCSYFLERSGNVVTPMKTGKTERMLRNPDGKDFATACKPSKQTVVRITDTRNPVLVPAIPDSLRRDVPVSSFNAGNFKVKDKTIYTELPAGFFSDGKAGKDDELLKLINAGNEIVTFANKVYHIGSVENAKGDRAYVRGTVRDILSGEPLAGVAVFDEKSKVYAMTDNDGTYRVQLPLGENVLSFSGYSLEDMHLNIMVNSDGGLDVVMKEKVTSLKGAVVSAETMVNHRDTRMGIEKVRINTITKVPVAFGEADVLKVVMTLPGVKSVGEASSGFNVRGGSSDQNLVLFNDGTIYNPSHMFGIFSAFNTDVINDIELYKSSIPAEFGGRISSVLDVRGREGNSNKVQGSLGVGLLTSRFHLEGPLGSERTTFIVGGRTTYSNWLFNLLPKNSSYSGGTANFSDLNASVTHKVNDRNTIQAYGYWSRDKYTFDGDTTFRYSNVNFSLKWRSTVSDRTKSTVVAGYDGYKNRVDDNFNRYSAYSIATRINQGYAKAGFKTLLNDRHQLSYGLNSIIYSLNPGHMSPLGEESLVEDWSLSKQKAIESALYLGDTWTMSDKFSLDLGLRYSAFLSLEDKKFYGAPEYRLSAKYSFLDNLSLKAGFNTMTQYIHLISNTASVSPMDAWNLSNSKMKPQEGWQAASGLYWTINDNKIDLSLEAYYKRSSHSLDYKSGAVLIMNPFLQDELVETYGKAYGIEFMIKKTLGKLNGWISYTYSRSLLKEMQDRGVETINAGQWYNAPYDKPHDFKLVGNYKFTHRYSLSVNVDYSTGRPVTLPVSTYQYGGGRRLAYSVRNGYRIPDYFRMDVAMNIDPGHYLRKLTHMTWTVGVYNITGRKNAYSVYYSTNGGGTIKGYMLSVFAYPIPYININLKFG